MQESDSYSYTSNKRVKQLRYTMKSIKRQLSNKEKEVAK